MPTKTVEIFKWENHVVKHSAQLSPSVSECHYLNIKLKDIYTNYIKGRCKFSGLEGIKGCRIWFKLVQIYCRVKNLTFVAARGEGE